MSWVFWWSVLISKTVSFYTHRPSVARGWKFIAVCARVILGRTNFYISVFLVVACLRNLDATSMYLNSKICCRVESKILWTSQWTCPWSSWWEVHRLTELKCFTFLWLSWLHRSPPLSMPRWKKSSHWICTYLWYPFQLKWFIVVILL